MTTGATRRKKWIWPLVLLALAVIFLWLAAGAGRFLIVDKAQSSDLILVLAGETDRRPARALELLRQGLARKIVLDVPADATLYGFKQLELARKWAQNLPEAAAISICPIAGLSTRDESHDASQCLARENGNRILIVTSDFHTRRALSVFQRELHGKSFSIAAARDNAQFGAHWWTHRQWAKTCVDEWMRVVWWNAVDRWR